MFHSLQAIYGNNNVATIVFGSQPNINGIAVDAACYVYITAPYGAAASQEPQLIIVVHNAAGDPSFTSALSLDPHALGKTGSSAATLSTLFF